MNRNRIFIFAAATLSAALWAYACGDGTTEPPAPPPDPPRPTTVTVTPATARLSALGATVQLSAEVRDQNGQVLAGAAVAWASDDAPLATVDASGLVTAVGNGAATITATAGGANGTATVTVAQEVSTVAVSPPADTLVEADTVRISAEAADANGHAIAGAVFAWASSDTLVARVDDDGLVTGVAAGETAITAAAGGVTGRAELVVTAPARWTLSGTVSHGWADPQTNGFADVASYRLRMSSAGESGREGRFDGRSVRRRLRHPEVRDLGPAVPVVTTPTGRVVGAIVEVVDGPDAGRQATTDDSGRYMLEALRPAEFTIRATAEGFVSVGRRLGLASDTVLDFAISHEPPAPQPPSPFPDTDPAWLRALAADYPHAHQVANVRVFSDISPTFSKEHAEHLKRVWDFFDALYARNRGAHIDAYYTSDPAVFQKVVPHCPTIFIPGARNVTTCYFDYPRWFVIPYQIPDFGTQLHEVGHDFLYATWPQAWRNSHWFIEGTAMYFEGGVFSGSLRMSTPVPYCTDLFQRYDHQARLMPLAQLLRLSRDAFLADPERTYSQSCMLFDYLEKHEPGVLYALIYRINSDQIVSNDQLITALLELTGKSVSQLEEAYQSHARGRRTP